MAIIFPDAAFATFCISKPSTLEEDYEKAGSVVIAQASGCPGTLLPDNGVCPDERYSFDVIEVLKDTVPPRDHGGVFQGSGFNGCGMHFRSGSSYLLFIAEDGSLNHGASGYLGGEDPRIDGTEERLKILREYRDGLIGDLSGPWRFYEHVIDHAHGCGVKHRLKRGELEFSYAQGDYDEYYGSQKLQRSNGPNGEIVLDTGPLVPEKDSFRVTMVGPDYGSDAILFSVSIGDSLATVEGTVLITVGQRAWPLHGRTVVVQFGSGDPITIIRNVAGGVAANEILDAMSEPTDVVISAVLSGFGWTEVDESPLPLKTRTTQLPSAAKKFKACVDALAGA